MNGPSDGNQAATSSEVRALVGEIDDAAIARIVALGATEKDILAARTWLESDDYLQRKLHHGLNGAAAAVFEILEAERPEPERL
jgi:hypothetical protein